MLSVSLAKTQSMSEKHLKSETFLDTCFHLNQDMLDTFALGILKIFSLSLTDWSIFDKIPSNSPPMISWTSRKIVVQKRIDLKHYFHNQIEAVREQH